MGRQRAKWQSLLDFENTQRDDDDDNGGGGDDELMESSVPKRIVSNPLWPRYGLISGDKPRSLSERPIPKALNKPLRAAELQKFHEFQEYNAKKPRNIDPAGNSIIPRNPALTTDSLHINTRPERSPRVSLQQTATTKAGKQVDSLGVLTSNTRSGSVISRRDQVISNSPKPHVVDPDLPLASVGNILKQGRDDMATAPIRISGDGRRQNRYENRPPMSTVLCRNGPQCRKFQEGTCHYNHDFGGSMSPNSLSNASVIISGMGGVVLSQDSLKKSLNVDSPSFTPTTARALPAKSGFSPKSAAAVAFTPRGSGSATPASNSHVKVPSTEFIPQDVFQPQQQFQDFVPGQPFLSSPHGEVAQLQQLTAYGDPFLAHQGITGLDTQVQLNPYTQQPSNVATPQFFQDASSFKHPLNYHLYSSIGPRRENLMAYQRSTSDFFIPDDLREDLQRKSEAALQTFANSTLAQTVEYFHSLVALDTNASKGSSVFGYPSWIYKATSSRDGHTYALRRIEGYRLSSEAAIRTINQWKRISNASMVQIHDAFTGRWFGDSSLIVVTDYHPRSQTLAEKHSALGKQAPRSGGQVTPENELWGYIVQLASVLKTIHEANLASQTVVPSKILVTAKNRLRLNGCGVLDVVQFEHRKTIQELQRGDLQDLGRLILGLAARNLNAHQNTPKALELVSRSYSERLRSCIAWLVAPPPIPSTSPQQPESSASVVNEYNVHTFLTNIADKVVAALDSTLHLEDELTSNLARELENGRLVRLLAKLNVILERPDTNSSPSATTNPALLNQPSAAWSETGERYYLKLFRDYVFHQVDHDGRPVLDLGHIITCLNKLDAGIDEKIQLVSRDEQSIFITSYKEVKRGFESAWTEINKATNITRR